MIGDTTLYTLTSEVALCDDDMNYAVLPHAFTWLYTNISFPYALHKGSSPYACTYRHTTYVHNVHNTTYAYTQCIMPTCTN